MLSNKNPQDEVTQRKHHTLCFCQLLEKNRAVLQTMECFLIRWIKLCVKTYFYVRKKGQYIYSDKRD